MSEKKKIVNFFKTMPLVLAQYDDMVQEFWGEIICYTGRQTKWSFLTQVIYKIWSEKCFQHQRHHVLRCNVRPCFWWEGWKQRGKGKVGDVMRGYNKDEFKFYFTHTEELSMRFIRSKYVIIQATHISSI